MTDQPKRFESWAIVELLGRQKVAGLCSEEVIAGQTLLRVDIPKPNGETDFTRYYGPGSIYCISPVDKNLAVGVAMQLQQRPVSVYDVSQFARDKQLEFGTAEEP